jgi:TatA/E family protein of Tat protein translocase
VDIGAPELLIILVIGLLIFGSNKLPKLARSLGQASREFKAATSQGFLEDQVTAATTTPPPATTVPATTVPATTTPTDTAPTDTTPTATTPASSSGEAPTSEAAAGPGAAVEPPHDAGTSGSAPADT